MASLELVEGCLAQSNTAGVPDDNDDHNVSDKEDYITIMIMMRVMTMKQSIPAH